MGRTGRVLVSVLVSVLVLSGLGATAAVANDQNTSDGVETAAQRFYQYINDRQWGTYYRFLHPAQRALVSKDAFMACFDKAVPNGLSVNNVEVTVVTKATVIIEGTDTPTKARALTIKYTIERENSEQGVTDRSVLIWVKSKWTWVMSADRLAACTGG